MKETSVGLPHLRTAFEADDLQIVLCCYDFGGGASLPMGLEPQTHQSLLVFLPLLLLDMIDSVASHSLATAFP
eukprot:5271811-Amphidinium_carterae.1